MKLFDDDWGEDNSPIEDPEITQVIIYLGAEDAKLFKRLAKEGMKVEFPDYIKDGNISELLLKLLKEKYANLLPQKTFDTGTSRSAEGQLFN